MVKYVTQFHSGNLKLYKEDLDVIRNEQNLAIKQWEQAIVEKNMSDVEKERMLFDSMVQNILSMNKASTTISNLVDQKKDSMSEFKSVAIKSKGKPI